MITSHNLWNDKLLISLKVINNNTYIELIKYGKHTFLYKYPLYIKILNLGVTDVAFL